MRKLLVLMALVGCSWGCVEAPAPWTPDGSADAPPAPDVGAELTVDLSPRELVDARIPPDVPEVADADSSSGLQDTNSPTDLVDVNSPTDLVDVNSPTDLVDVNSPTDLNDSGSPTDLVELDALFDVAELDSVDLLEVADLPPEVFTCETCTADCACPVCGNGELEVGEECDDGNEVAWDGCTECLRSEQMINVVTAGDQEHVTSSASALGHRLVVWQGDAESDGKGVFGRFLDPDSGEFSDEMRFDNALASEVANPSAAMWPSGMSIVVWQSENPADGFTSIRARRFDAGGTPIDGSEFMVHTDGVNQAGEQYPRQHPAVAVYGDGASKKGFVVTWECFAEAAAQTKKDICFRHFNAAGTPSTIEDNINDFSTNMQEHGAVAAHASGNAHLAWGSNQGGHWDIALDKILADGTQAPTWEAYPGSDKTLDQHNPSIAPLFGATEGYVIVWEDTGGNCAGGSCLVGKLNSDGKKSSGMAFSPAPDSASAEGKARVAAFIDDSFVVVWQSSKLLEAGSVHAQVFDSSGQSKGLIEVATAEDYDQRGPSVNTFPDNSFLVAWESCPEFGQGTNSGQDGAGCGVFFRRYDALLNPLYD